MHAHPAATMHVGANLGPQTHPRSDVGGILIDLFHPIAYAHETRLVSNIVYQKYTHSTSIICSCYSPESLLACGIPYLQLYFCRLVDEDGFDFKIDSNCCDK